MIGVPLMRIQRLVLDRVRPSLAGATVQPPAVSVLVYAEGFISSSAQLLEDGRLPRTRDPGDIDERHEFP